MLEAPDCMIGEKLECPICRCRRKVPKETPKYARPTERQLQLARFFKINLQPDISKQELGEILKEFPESEYPASGNQKEYALKLGLKFPDTITMSRLSELISSVAADKKPATEKQKNFARNIGVKFKDIITMAKMNELLDKKLKKIPPSEGQLNLAEELEIDIPANCSYYTLSKLIDKAMDDENGN